MASPLPIDALIIGGGIAGLWTLDALTRAGRSAILIERTALGDGQSIWSQGIIHSGVKYSLAGALSKSARAIRDMPRRWNDAFAGKSGPDLRSAKLRANHCWLWQTDSITSQAGMMGAMAGLRVAPVVVEDADRPSPLAGTHGDVARLDEPVIDVASVLSALARAHRERIVLSELDRRSFGEPGADRAPDVEIGPGVRVHPRWLILAAGNGAGALRETLGLPPKAMQVRPLRMVMSRGIRANLPELNGHCVDGASTRVTITSGTDAHRRTVWQIGGQIAEQGANMEPETLLTHAVREIRAVVPGVDASDCHWATYDAPRAEGRTPLGRRPAGPVIVREGRILSVWPTKLALAPAAADMVLEAVAHDAPVPAPDLTSLGGVEHPGIAMPIWDRPDIAWRSTDSITEL